MIKFRSQLAVIAFAVTLLFAIGLFVNVNKASAELTPYQIYVNPDANDGEGKCVFTYFYIIPLAFETNNTNTTYARRGTRVNSTCHLDLSHYVDNPEMAAVLGEGEASCFIQYDEYCYDVWGHQVCLPLFHNAQQVQVVVTPSGNVNASCHADLNGNSE